MASSPIRLLMRLLMVATAIACLAPVAASAVVLGPKQGGPLSPELRELAKPAVAAEGPAAQAEQVGLPVRGPGSLVKVGGKVLVTARFEGGMAARLDELRAAGAGIVSSSHHLQTVTLAVAPERLPAVAAVPGVQAVWQALEPITYAPEGPCEGGSVISEGLEQLRVDEAREAFELRGGGITVGVLSDSYDTATGTATDAEDDVLSNDLPGPGGSCSDQQLPVNVLDEGPAGEGDEGRAMLQIVHDLAPKAGLAFATAFESEQGFAQNIERLARPVSEGGAGAEVIVDDVSWFEEPFFQDGPVAVAINRVTEAGVSYLTATGNGNLFDSLGNEISSWEAPGFRDSGDCPEAVKKLAGFNGTHCMDFDPEAGTDRTFGITVKANQVLRVGLQWAEPWNGVLTDLDAFLLTGEKLIPASFARNVTGTQRPFEFIAWKNPTGTAKTVELVINRFSGLSPRLKFILLQNGGGVSAIEYPEPGGEDVVGPSIYGHAGAAAAISVAAVPFDNSNAIEPYSSRGPVTHYFGPVESALPAPPLIPADEIAKPDIAATDCGATTFFSFLDAGVWRFCGTSAAAPHVAGVAALVRQAKPGFFEQQVREALTDSAVPVGAFPPEAAGAGLVDAFATIAALPGPLEGEDGPSEPVPPIESPAPAGVTTNATISPAGSPSQAPTTRIVRRPAKVVRTRGTAARVVFRFGADQAVVTFRCKIDRARFRSCRSRLVRRFGLGRHVLRVKAVNAAGQVDPTPAVFRFRVVETDG